MRQSRAQLKERGKTTDYSDVLNVMAPKTMDRCEKQILF